MGDYKGMGSVPGNVQGAGLTRQGDTAGNVRDAVEEVTDMGAQAMGHAGDLRGGERGGLPQDPARQQYEAQAGEGFDKKDVIRPKRTGGKAEGGFIYPSGTGQTDPETAE